MRRLILNYWKSNNEERRLEVDNCIVSNILSNIFDHIVLIANDDHINHITNVLKNISKNNVLVMSHKNNLSYRTIFDIVDSITDYSDTNILSNNDILFDESIKLSDNILYNEFYCLTRYNEGILDWIVPPAPYYASDSQDTWIWKGKNKSKESKGSVFLGHPGCDNRMAFDAFLGGYDVRNPSLDIKTHHIHKTNIRGESSNNISKRILDPYMFVKPTKLNEPYMVYVRLGDGREYSYCWDESKITKEIRITIHEQLNSHFLRINS